MKKLFTAFVLMCAVLFAGGAVAQTPSLILGASSNSVSLGSTVAITADLSSGGGSFDSSKATWASAPCGAPVWTNGAYSAGPLTTAGNCSYTLEYQWDATTKLEQTVTITVKDASLSVGPVVGWVVNDLDESFTTSVVGDTQTIFGLEMLPKDLPVDATHFTQMLVTYATPSGNVEMKHETATSGAINLDTRSNGALVKQYWAGKFPTGADVPQGEYPLTVALTTNTGKTISKSYKVTVTNGPGFVVVEKDKLYSKPTQTPFSFELEGTFPYTAPNQAALWVIMKESEYESRLDVNNKLKLTNLEFPDVELTPSNGTPTNTALPLNSLSSATFVSNSDDDIGVYIVQLFAFEEIGPNAPVPNNADVHYKDTNTDIWWKKIGESPTVRFNVLEPTITVTADPGEISAGESVIYTIDLKGFPPGSIVSAPLVGNQPLLATWNPTGKSADEVTENLIALIDEEGTATVTSGPHAYSLEHPNGQTTFEVSGEVGGKTYRGTATVGVVVDCTNPNASTEDCYDPEEGLVGLKGNEIGASECTEQIDPSTNWLQPDGTTVRLPVPPIMAGTNPPRRHGCFCYQRDGVTEWYTTVLSDVLMTDGRVAQKPVAQPVNYCIALADPIGDQMAITGNDGADLFANFIQALYRYGAAIIGTVAVLIIVFSGIQMIMAGANPGMYDEAKTRIVQTLLSIILLFSTSIILRTINPGFFTSSENGAGADTDSDTMPDWWERKYGLDPLDPSDGIENRLEDVAKVDVELCKRNDIDGDKVSNRQEYFRGTSPILNEAAVEGYVDPDAVTACG